MKKLRQGVGERARGFLRDWTLPRQFAGQSPYAEGAKSTASKNLRPRLELADTVGTSVCPFCAVGCGQLVYARNGKPVHIEGDPRNPINQGTLCPKGASTLGVLTSPDRLNKVMYRAPYGTAWEERDLEWAMDRVAALTRKARDETFVERLADGQLINQTVAVGSLGGATLDNEENYLIKKLFGGGLGMVNIENQARI